MNRDHDPLRRGSALWLTVTGILTAMNIVLSMSVFSIPIPIFSGHFYFCDVIIDTAAILLDPFAAFVVGGVGSFLGDMMFYPQAMFVSLVSHGLQAVAVSVLSHRALRGKEALASVLGVAAGSVIMVVGYTLGRAYIYSTPPYALGKLPFEILQAALGAFLSILLCYPLKLKKTFHHLMSQMR